MGTYQTDGKALDPETVNRERDGGACICVCAGGE